MSSKISNSFVGLGCIMPFLGVTVLVYFFYNHSFLLGCIAVVVSVFLSIILFGMVVHIEENRKQKQIKFLQTFQPNHADSNKLKSFTSYDLLAKIAIDQQQKNVYVWIPDTGKDENISKAFVGMPYFIKTYNFSEVLAIKFLENGHEMASAQKDTHYTNYLLNKIREEETTNQSTHPPIDKVNAMDLEVFINDNANPRHRLRFYYEPHRQIRKDSPEYEAFYKECQKCFNLLKAIVYESEHNLEESVETNDYSLTEETLNELTQSEKTQIMTDIDTNQISLRLSEDSPAMVHEDFETADDDLKQEKTEERPTSYFEQLVEKNRRQLRGDYTEE